MLEERTKKKMSAEGQRKRCQVKDSVKDASAGTEKKAPGEG